MELFACIVSSKTPYTQNKSGFLNLTKLPPRHLHPSQKNCFPIRTPNLSSISPWVPFPRKPHPFTILNPFSLENLGKIWCQKKLPRNKFLSFKTDWGSRCLAQEVILRDSRLILGRLSMTDALFTSKLILSNRCSHH